MGVDFVMNDEVSRLTREVEAAKTKLREAVGRANPESVEDFQLKRLDGTPVRLSELFGGRADLIVWHNMGRSCVYCTMWADGLKGLAEHILSRSAFVLCSPDEPMVLKEFSEGRGWTFPRVSAAGSNFLKAMKMADANTGSPWPGISAFHKEGARIVRTGWTYFGPGDDFCPVWPALDLLKNGANGWEPRYSYKPETTAVGVPAR